MNEMDDDVARRRAFLVWLRTGRLPCEADADGVEFKFNPWHDPENGRFTFAGTGHYYGRGSGGQSEGRGRDLPSQVRRADGPPGTISNMAEADAWRAEALARSGHRPLYRMAIEARYQYYRKRFARRPQLPSGTSRPAHPVGPQGSPAGRGKPRTWGGGGFTGGGGGDFGGGGATGDGNWGGETKKPQARRAGAGLQRTPPRIVAQPPRASAGPQRRSPPVEARRPRTVASPQQSTRRVQVRRPTAGHGPRSGSEDWRTVERNGYRYEIDDQNRTRRISGEITLNPDQGRSRSAQLGAGGSDRREGDHGGHYIARRFNGPKEAFNHFAQDGSFNRSDYAKLENQWEQAKRLRKQVRIKIVPVFEGKSQRPSALNVWFWIDGHRESLQLPNKSKEKRDGK